MKSGKLIWNDAPGAGIILGLVSVSYFLLGQWMTLWQSPVLSNVLSVIFWIVKFVGCLYLLRFFMRKFVAKHEGLSNPDSFAFGCAVALLSALLYAVVYLAYIQFIKPDFFDDAIRQSLAVYSSMLDANSREALEQMLPRMPMITFFVNFIYCSIFGVVVSAIFSRNIPSRNPFKEN